MACTFEAPEYFQTNCPNTIRRSIVFRLDQLKNFSRDAQRCAYFEIENEAFIEWLPGTAVFTQELTGWSSFDGTEKVGYKRFKQTFEGKVLIDTEQTRRAIISYQDACKLCFIHDVGNNIGFLHGASGVDKSPYFRRMELSVFPSDFKTMKLPFTAHLMASCTTNELSAICDLYKATNA